MPSSAWFSFKKMVESMKKDFPHSFVSGPGDGIDEAILTWDNDGYLLLAFPCKDPRENHREIYKSGKLHKHIDDGLWHIIVTPDGGQAVVSQ
jgi:hypothetical protein